MQSLIIVALIGFHCASAALVDLPSGEWTGSVYDTDFLGRYDVAISHQQDSWKLSVAYNNPTHCQEIWTYLSDHGRVWYFSTELVRGHNCEKHGFASLEWNGNSIFHNALTWKVKWSRARHGMDLWGDVTFMCNRQCPQSHCSSVYDENKIGHCVDSFEVDNQ